MFDKLDDFIAHAQVEVVILYKQAFGVQSNLLFGVQNQGDMFLPDHVKDEQGLIFIGKINLFSAISIYLGEIIAVLIPFDAGVKVLDDFVMLELPMRVAPAAVLVEPENGILFGNHVFFDLICHLIVRCVRSGNGSPGGR